MIYMSDLIKLKHEFEHSSNFLVALGDPKRQAIILALLDKKVIHRGLRVNELTDVVALSRPAVSHHLKLLKAVGLIDYHRVGTKNYYYLTHRSQQIQQLETLLTHVQAVMASNEQL